MTTPTLTEIRRNGNPVGERIKLGRYTVPVGERIAYDVARDGPLVVLVPLAASIMPAVAVASEG